MDPQAPGPPAPPSGPTNPYAPPPPGDPQGYGSPGGGSTARLPWEERSTLGFGTALVETTKLLIKDPADAFSRLRADEDLVSPIFYGVILSLIGAFFSQLWSLLMGSALTAFLPSDEALPGMAMMAGTGVVQMVVMLVLSPILYLVGLFIGAGLYHLGLMVVGALNDSPMKFEGTLKVTAYASVASLAYVVPFVGAFGVFLWSIVLVVIGFMAVHRAPTAKAIIGALLPMVLCCVCVGIIALFFGAAIAASLGAAANSGWLAF